MKCCVPGCDYSFDRRHLFQEGRISLHRFPQIDLWRRTWIQILKINPTSTARICSRHFERQYFDHNSKNAKLSLVAVPTLGLFLDENVETSSKEMLCEDSKSHMSVDSLTRSPFKLSPVKLLNNSWLDEVENSTAARSAMDFKDVFKAELDASNDNDIKPIIKIEETDVPANITATALTTTTTPTGDLNFLNIKDIIKTERDRSADRDIEVEFLDVSNEEKYDRLIKDEKIKNPFKRRLSSNSNESRSTSPMNVKPAIDTAGVATSAATSHTKKSKIELESLQRSVSTGSSGSTGVKRGAPELETNEEILSRRQKQIQYGKNTVGYDNYMLQVPRKERTKDHPWTPPKRNKYSRRAWDGLVKVWRKKLHCWDPAGTKPDHNDQSSDDDE